MARGLARDGGAIRSRAPMRGDARWPARRMAGGTGVFGTRRGRRMRRQGNTRRRAMPQFVAGSGLPAGRAGSPSKTYRRTPARPADAAPGAVASSASPSKQSQRRNRRRPGAWRSMRSRAYRIDKHAVVDAIRGSGPIAGAKGGRCPAVCRELRGPRTLGDCGHADGLPFQHIAYRRCARRRRRSGARPELRPEAPAEGARQRLARHAHGALLRAGADGRHCCTNSGSRGCGPPG